MARDTGPQCKQCRREGQKLFLKGERCLTDKCGVERRSYPPGEHGRGRMKQSEYRVQLREKQKAKRYYGVLEKQFARLLREGFAPDRYHRREPACAAGVPPRQRPCAPRLRGFAPSGAPADPPRPLDGQRPARGHPQLPGATGRRNRDQGGDPGHAGGQRCHRADRTDSCVATGRPRVAHGQGAAQAGAT